MVMVMLN